MIPPSNLEQLSLVKSGIFFARNKTMDMQGIPWKGWSQSRFSSALHTTSGDETPSKGLSSKPHLWRAIMMYVKPMYVCMYIYISLFLYTHILDYTNICVYMCLSGSYLFKYLYIYIVKLLRLFTRHAGIHGFLATKRLTKNSRTSATMQYSNATVIVATAPLRVRHSAPWIPTWWISYLGVVVRVKPASPWKLTEKRWAPCADRYKWSDMGPL